MLPQLFIFISLPCMLRSCQRLICAFNESTFVPLHGREGDSKAQIPLSAQYIEIMKIS